MGIGMLAAPWVVWTSLAAGGAQHAAGSAVIGSAGFDHPVASWIEVEAHSGVGGLGESKDGTALLRIGAGGRITPVHSEFRPFLYAGLAHWHTVSYPDLKRAPASNIMGDSNAGMHHRTGGEVGIGFSWPTLIEDDLPWSHKLRSEVRLSTVILPDNMGPGKYLFGEISLGYVF